MYFDFSDSFWVSDNDLKAMAKKVKKTGRSVQDVVNEFSLRWDDPDFYLFGLVEDQVVAEVEKRVTSAL